MLCLVREEKEGKEMEGRNVSAAERKERRRMDRQRRINLYICVERLKASNRRERMLLFLHS